MCGISGFVRLGISDEECKLLAQTLLLELESRGTDATGIYTNGWVTKAPFSAKNFVDFLPEEYGKFTLLHNRNYTKGSPKDNNNNHPLYSENWVLIHNGVIEMDRIATYPYQGQVDTEILLSYVEKEGMLPAIQKIQGSAAIAAIEKKGDGIYLWRNTPPIILGLVPRKVLMFASEAEAIVEASDAVFGKIHGRFSKAFLANTYSDTLMKIHPNGQVADLFSVKAKLDYIPYKVPPVGKNWKDYDDEYRAWYGEPGWSPDETPKTGVQQTTLDDKALVYHPADGWVTFARFKQLHPDLDPNKFGHYYPDNEKHTKKKDKHHHRHKHRHH